MRRAVQGIGLIALVSGALLGQGTAATPAAFDIADVHISPKTLNARMSGGTLRGTRFDLKQATMVDLVRIAYDLDAEKGMTVSNDTAGLYRYFDLTAQAEYLYQCIEEAIHRDLRDEIGFLAVFDAAMRAVLNIVDMPNRRASLLVRFIQQNKGKLSKGKRTTFSEISDQEIDRIEKAVWGAWQDAHPAQVPEDRS